MDVESPGHPGQIRGEALLSIWCCLRRQEYGLQASVQAASAALQYCWVSLGVHAPSPSPVGAKGGQAWQAPLLTNMGTKLESRKLGMKARLTWVHRSKFRGKSKLYVVGQDPASPAEQLCLWEETWPNRQRQVPVWVLLPMAVSHMEYLILFGPAFQQKRLSPGLWRSCSVGGNG